MRTAESLIQEKSFQELNQEELALVMELVEDEQSFNEMKHFFSELEGLKTTLQVEPSTELKASLDQVFKAKHPGITIQTTAAVEHNETTTKEVRLHRALWFRIAAMLIIFIGISVYFLMPKTEQTPQVTAKVDKPETESTVESKVITPSKIEESQPLLANNAPVETSAVTTSVEPIEFAEDLAVSAPTTAGSVISYAERGMSADLFVNSDKDLASKSFAQPIAPDVLMQFLEPAF
jgi:hypothetical protein